MHIETAWKAAAASFSEAYLKLLEHAERRPELMQRSTFAALDESDIFTQGPYEGWRLQSWPVLIGQEKIREYQRVTVGLGKLAYDVTRRVFGKDAAAIGRYYGLDRQLARFVAGTLGRRQDEGMLTRGDYYETTDGLKCMEINATALLGGWQTLNWAQRYLRVPAIQRFLAEEGLRVSCRDTARHQFTLLARESQGLSSDGELNLAIAVDSEEGSMEIFHEYLEQRWSEAIADLGLSASGSVRLCAPEELTAHRERVYLDGSRIHAVLELYPHATPQELLMPWVVGNVRIYTGPLRRVRHHKGNLALLSEHQSSTLFSPEERELIRRYVPWTRRVTAGSILHDRRRVSFKELLLAEHRSLVLKPLVGFSGEGVVIGKATSEERWEQEVDQAVQGDHMLVQQLVESRPFPLLQDGQGCVPYTLIMGLFAFGDDYAGCVVRNAPSDGSGAVSHSLGALSGVLLEVED